MVYFKAALFSLPTTIYQTLTLITSSVLVGIFEQTLIFFQCKQVSIMCEQHKDLDVWNLATKK